MKSRNVIDAWVRSGIRDFCLYVELQNAWSSYNAFFLHQGLEKLCKAYLLGARAKEYEGIALEHQARQRVQEIAKKLGHDLLSMLKQLDKLKVISVDQIKTIRSDDKTGHEIIEAIQQGYEECRYPLPLSPVYKKYPIKGYRKVYEDLLGCTVLKDIPHLIAGQILSKIREDFSFAPSKDKATYNSKMPDNHWNLVLPIFPS